MIWGWLIPGWLRRAAMALGAAAMLALGAFAAGKREARRDAKAKAAEDHIKTRKEIDDALADSRRDGASWRERLRGRHK